MILPLSLKIIAGMLLLLVLLFFILKKQRKLTGLLILLTAGAGIWQGLKEYNRTNTDMANAAADVKIPSSELIKSYETSDSLSNKKYLGKILEVNGHIKKIETDDNGSYTVVLGDTSSLSSVRCSMDSTHQKDASKLTGGSSISIRGVCTGFNKDDMGLGSDVILNRCVILKN
ncbi:MAG: hypothetical protein B6D37_07545 [Sphingobacteriales bacterium UTBCD1]|jgi:uncharacterized protein (DUF1330 family)|nr:MAG: hypothetical protein B6D37_07545 [Sphingobacteriales bacterium UTBCD1]